VQGVHDSPHVRGSVSATTAEPQQCSVAVIEVPSATPVQGPGGLASPASVLESADSAESSVESPEVPSAGASAPASLPPPEDDAELHPETSPGAQGRRTARIHRSFILAGLYHGGPACAFLAPAAREAVVRSERPDHSCEPAGALGAGLGARGGGSLPGVPALRCACADAICTARGPLGRSRTRNRTHPVHFFRPFRARRTSDLMRGTQRHRGPLVRRRDHGSERTQAVRACERAVSAYEKARGKGPSVVSMEEW
jgi:hypothetical protein